MLSSKKKGDIVNRKIITIEVIEVKHEIIGLLNWINREKLDKYVNQ